MVSIVGKGCKEMLDGKSLMLLQICFQCGRKFQYKRGRKSCPFCESILRTRTMIVKVTRS